MVGTGGLVLFAPAIGGNEMAGCLKFLRSISAKSWGWKFDLIGVELISFEQ